MENYPGNRQTLGKVEVVEEEKKPKVEKIIAGRAVRRKTPLGKRFVETFFSGSNSVWTYILHDILLPAAKDTITDVVSQGIERMVYGESRSTSRRTGTRPAGPAGYVSYNRYSQTSQQREQPRVMSRRARASHDFQDIILPTRAEAESVIDALYDLVQKYEQATVADLYGLVGIPAEFTDENWGWRDISRLGQGPKRMTDGYWLPLQKPEPLD